MRLCVIALVAALNLPAQSSTQQPTYQPGWPCTGKERAFDPAYLHATEATGGQLFLFDKSETVGSATAAIAASKHPVTITRSVGNLNNYLDVRVPVDSSVESLYVSATVQCLQRVILWDPQIVEVLPQQIGGEDHVFRAVRISVIPNPVPGVWTVRLLGTGSYSLVAQAKTTLTLSGNFDGQNITASTNVPGASFRLVTEAGDPLQPLALDLLAPGRYSGPVKPLTQKFRLLMENIDPQGVPFQRMDPRLFEAPR